jgi:hypothetical protein
MKRFLVLTLLLASTEVFADSIAITGFGKTSTWDSDLVIANPTAAPMTVQVGNSGTFQPPVCTNQCGIVHLTIPSHGVVRLTTTDVPNVENTMGILHTVFVTAAGTLPVVRARVFNMTNAQQAIEIPAVRVSTISDVRELAFPAVIRTTDAHTNVTIARPTGDPTPIHVRGELFSTSGELLSTRDFTNTPVGNYYPNVFVVDIVNLMGVTAIDGGLLRITSTDGEPIWGFTSVVFPAGNVSQVVGSNP